MSVFASLQPVPADPILGVTEAFNADQSPDKINLGVGVYVDEQGRIPLLDSVTAAQADLDQAPHPYGYLPQTGIPAYDQASAKLVFGANSPALLGGRIVSIQTLGGTGALRIGAGLFRLATPQATVLISDPSWENHRLIFERTGYTVGTYRYYDAQTGGVDFDGLLADLNQAAAGTIVILHGCCHNPTGCDLTPAQWDQVIAVLQERDLVPFIDFAYQGLGHGLDQDRYVVEALVDAGLEFAVANSYSKTFSLYGERVGAIHWVTADASEATRVASQAKTVVRSLYSNPPTHGAELVAAVLNTPELGALWEQEVAGMRDRIKAMRAAFRTGLESAGVSRDLNYITTQVGMFTYSGLTPTQMARLRQDFHIYGLDSGRLCMAALNQSNIERVVAGVAAVMG
ncbi:MAG: aspartate/tyrosine/aromatic aminotransferase [Propionibacteriaceae bacterium]|jgi:aromatic-amino-acid transaminase|nr:aspartate/tyrosine/aromatic aminotransferase [Propionibacteriaceae bacterium]